MRFPRRIFAVVVLAAAAAVSSLVASIPASVSGTVLASHNNQPLAGVQINVYDGAGAWVTSSPTDANGDYTLNGLPEGTYYLSTWNSQGYVDQAWNGVICPACWPLQNGTPLVVPAGGLTDIDFVLALGGRISGRLTAAGGAPLPNIHLHVYSQTGTYAGGGYTDASGDYLTSAMPAGSYRVRTYNTQGYLDEAFNNLPCYSCTADFGALVAVAVNATTANIDFALDPGGQFAGRVTDAASQPLAGVSITVLDLAGNVVGGGYTDVIGDYLTSAVPTGSYRLRTWNTSGYIDEAYDDLTCVNCAPVTGTPIAIAGAATTGNVNFSLALGGQIRATVTADAGGPLPGVHVEIYNAAGAPLSGRSTNVNGVTDDGRGLPDGTYYAVTYNALGYVDEVYGLGPCLNCQPTLGTPIVVTAGNTTDIAFSLGLGNRISGRVTSSGGTPLEGVWVQAEVPNGGRGAQTGPDGTYEIGGLPDGTYHLRTFNQLGYVDQVYGGTECSSCPPQSGTPIVLSGTSTFAGADFALNLGGSIIGIVTGAGGLPLSGVSVWVFDSTGQWNGSAVTDGAGAYAIASLRAASYFVRTSNNLGYVDELHDNIACSNCAVTTGTPVVVSAGGTAFANFSLTQGGTIAGVITDGMGNPLPFISVNVHAVADPNMPIAFASTNAAGQYATSGGLVAGQYLLRTYNNSGYVDEVFDNISCASGCANADGTPVTVTAGGQTVADFSLVLGGRISGTVTGAGGPLEGVNVSVYTAAGVSVTGMNTDAAGQYQVYNALTPGQYFVRTFNAPGHIDELYDDIPCVPSCTVTAGTPVTVTAGGTASINFALTPGGTIAGVITDGTGSPLPSISVNVYAVADPNMPIAFASTNAAGQYATSGGLVAGQYLLRTFNNLGYIDEVFDNISCASGCANADGTPVSVAVGGQAVANFSLVHGGRIAGTVTGASGPLAGVNVSIYSAAGVPITGASTDAAGQYQVFNALTPGQYFVRTFSAPGHIDELYDDIPCVPSCTVTAGTPVTVTAGGTASVNFALTLGGAITGVITDGAGNLLPSIPVHVFAVTNPNMAIAFAVTNTSGQYATMGGLPAGQYFVRTFNNSGYVDELFDNVSCMPGCTNTDGTPVTVTAGGQTVVDFSLVHGGRIAGTVTGPNGPLAGVNVTIYSAAGVMLNGANTDGAGQYQIYLTLPPGQYFLRTFNAPGHLNELYNDIPCVPSCTVTAGTPVMVTAGGTATADFTLTASSAIEGTVTAVGGAPLAGTNVWLHSATGEFIQSANTDASGFYRMANDIVAGTYYLRTFNSAGYLNEVWDNVACQPFCTVTTGTAIVLGAGATATANFELTQGMVITGTVTRSDTSATMSSVNVQLLTATGFVTSNSTNASGQYSMVVAPGTYYLRTTVNPATGLIDQLHDGVQCAPSCATTLGTPVTGSSTVNFALHPQAILTGRATDGTNGLNGVTVSAYSSTGVFLRSATTTTVGGVSGVYTIDRLAAGPVLVRTQNNAGFLDEAHDNILCSNSCAIATVGATPVVLTAGATTTINFALARLGSITGVVTDAGTGLPIVGAQVRAFNSAGVQTFGGTITDATGAYTLQSLQTGTYYVQALSGNPAFPGAFGYLAEMYDDVECAGCSPLLGAPVAAAIGSATSGINFALNRGTQISGEVRIGGTLATSGTVNFFNSIGRFVGSTSVGATGAFVSRDGFPAGTFFARATSTGGLQELYDNVACFPSCASTAGTPIMTAGAGVPMAGINFDLTVGGVITGTVLRDGVAVPSGTSVAFVDALGRTVGSAQIFAGVNTYQSSALASGQYWVVTSNNNGTVNQVYGGGTCLGCDVRAQGTPVDVTAGATTSGIDFNLTAGGRFSGTVTTTSGAVLQGITVQVVTGTTVISQSTTGSTGTFTTGPGLPAGTYTLRTLNNVGYWNAQQNADIVGTATTSGLLFQLDVDLDSDGDGIHDSVDRVAATGAEESATPSNQFSDVIPGGFTSGAITDRGGWGVTVADQVLGVRLAVSGGGTSPVIVDTCAQGGAEQLRMASAGDAVGVSCNPISGSTSLRVFQSIGIVELRKTIDGVTTVIQLTTGQGVTFGSPVTAESDNSSPVVVRLFNDAGDEIGSLTLAPGESVDTSVDAGGTLTVSVISGNVTMTVLGETVTVYQGASASFTLPSTSVTPARMRAQGHWDQAAKQKLHLVFDGRVDASGAGSGSLAVWATGGGKPLGRFESTSVSSATFTPAGSGGTMVMTGAGVLGKQAGYTFAITVTDGGGGQDSVSVTVTNAQGVVVYQGSGPLSGGSVQLLPN